MVRKQLSLENALLRAIPLNMLVYGACKHHQALDKKQMYIH